MGAFPKEIIAEILEEWSQLIDEGVSPEEAKRRLVEKFAEKEDTAAE